MPRPVLRFRSLARLALAGCASPAALLLAACSSSSGGTASNPPSTPLSDTAASGRVVGQHEFLAALPFGQGNGGSSAVFAGDSTSNGSAAVPATGATVGAGQTAGSTESADPRAVEETDLYVVDGDRLYYLNSYRGLLVFDISNVDNPQLLGRSPVFGTPIDMIVRNGVATVIVGDWYGTTPDGKPFYGSVVRGLDATDPTNIAVTGEAQVRGSIQDSRVVGDVLYTVSQDYGQTYGWSNGYYGGGVAIAAVGSSTTGGASTVITSVNVANGKVVAGDTKVFDGWGGVFNVTPNAILLAHTHTTTSTTSNAPSQTDLQYVDISDPGGAVRARGAYTVNGNLMTYGVDNGRWNLDFQDGVHAHLLAQGSYSGPDQPPYLLSTVDFTNPDAPTRASELSIASNAWTPAALFDGDRMYLSPNSSYGVPTGQTTPFQVYDLSNPAAPALAGSINVPGGAFLFVPNDTTSARRVFALGNDYSSSGVYDTSSLTLRYFDVTNASSPATIGSSSFGSGWGSTQAASTFKAFTKDDTKGLALVPFSGWDPNSQQYDNGVQLVQYSDTQVKTGGVAHTKGWVERGIFVKNRLVSLSDLALSVVDYTNPQNPQVVVERTLARNVVDARPQGATICEVSTDWWGNDTTSTELRVLGIADAQETTDTGRESTQSVAGDNAQVFINGNLTYLVTDVQHVTPCPANASDGFGGKEIAVPATASDPGVASGVTAPTCYAWTQRVQVADTSSGQVVLKGAVELPLLTNGTFGGWGWGGYYAYDWYNGADVVQVGGNALAFRRWLPQYSTDANGNVVYDDTMGALYVVDLTNPDAPTVGTTTITQDTTAWWGNMQAVGNTLYTTHYDWIARPVAATGSTGIGGGATGDSSGSDASVGVTTPSSPPEDAGAAVSVTTPAVDGGSAVGTVSAKTVRAQDVAIDVAPYYVKYYLDVIDLTDRAHPKVGQKINVPGVLVGASATDPTVLYTLDYRWNGNNATDDLAVVKVDQAAGLAYWEGSLTMNGDVGRVIVQGTTAYTTTQNYSWDPNAQTGSSTQQLHQIDLSNPAQPVDFVATGTNGWGWLLGVAGDRAVVTSGWYDQGIDIYRVAAGKAPTYDQFVRTNGWTNDSGLQRQDNSLYLSSGYWGVQKVDLTSP